MGTVCSSKKPLDKSSKIETFNIVDPKNMQNSSSTPIGKRVSQFSVKDFYTISPQIYGQGHFGTVRLCQKKSNPQQNYAVKTIAKEKVKDQSHLLSREVDALNQIDHPNIIKFYGSYEDEKYFHIVMEFCSGGELLDKIINASRLPE